MTGADLVSKVFKSLDDAKLEADYWVRHGQRRALGAACLSDRDAHDALSALELLVGQGIRDVSLVDLAKDYLSRVPDSKAVTVSVACEEYKLWRKSKGSSKDYLYSLKAHFKAIVHAYGDKQMTEVTEVDLLSWQAMVQASVAPKTHDNRVTSIKALFAREIKLKRLAVDPTDCLEKLGVVSEDASVLKPSDLHLLLIAALAADKADFALLVGLQAFAGLRRSEAKRIHWDDIKDESIRVTGIKSKVGRGRSVPILPALRFIIDKVNKSTGNVIKLSDYQYDTLKLKFAEQINIIIHPNSLRHSFVSYRLSSTKDAAKTAYEAGHSVQIQSQHYDGIASDKDAKSYFSFGK